MRSQCIHLALRDQFCYHATQNSLNPLKNFSGFGLVSTTDPVDKSCQILTDLLRYETYPV